MTRRKKQKIKARDVLIPLLLSSIIIFFVTYILIQPLTSSFSPTFSIHAASQVAWPMFDVDAQKSGYNATETTITKTTVRNLKQLWQVNLPNTADGSPIYLSGVTTPQGVKNLIFVTTTNGTLIAYDEINVSVVCSQNTQGNGSITTSSPVLD